VDKYLKEIEVAIQKAAIDGALSEAAVEQFHSVIQKCDDLTDKCVKLERTNEDLKKSRDELNTSFNQTSSTLSDYQTRERELVERETKNLELKLKAEHESKRVEDHKDMVKLVFRNLEVRRNVFPVSPAQHINDQGITAPGGYVEEKEQTEKTE